MVRGANYKLFIKGLLTELRTDRKGYLKKMMVSPDFIELWYKITENQFDLSLWSVLNQIERNWMIELAQKLKIDNKYLNIQHNKESSKYIDELQLLEGSINSGNNNKDLLTKYFSILDILKQRNMIEAWTVNSIKKNISRVFNQNLKEIEIAKDL